MTAGHPVHRFNLRKLIVLPLAVMAMVPAGLALAHPAQATNGDEPCTPSHGTKAVFGEWTPSGDFAQTPQDPDGQAGDDNQLNLKQIGEREENWVPGTEGSYTGWTNEGERIKTEENSAPGTDSVLVHYEFVGQTEAE